MIQLQNLTKIYRSRSGVNRVLNDVTMDIPTDRNVGILGRNGQGKSTLLRLIAKAESPTSGTIRTLARLSWPMGFAGGLQGSLSAVDNIRFVSRIHGCDWRKVLDTVADFTELGKRLSDPVSNYSSGMRARLNVGLSLAIQFDTYLIDEIPGVGDARFARKFNAAFDELKQKSSLIIVSHSAPTIRRHCDMAFMVSDGKLTRYDDLEEALRVYENE